MISMQEFKKVELCVARITSVENHPDADKLYVVQVDLGGETRTTVAGLKGHYDREELEGKLVVLVTNLEPARIRGVESKGMLLAAQQDEKVVLLAPERDIAPGSPVL